MQFVNPYFLFGLLAVAIPVIIHLFNFRRFRRVYFTNVKYLEELTQQTQKQSRLKHLLVLASRILAIICLVLAFAQPYVPLTDKPVRSEAKNAISIYIDNSFSMEARASKGNLLDEARLKAREIVDAYKTSDLFQLLTADFDGQHQRLVSRDEFIEMLDGVKISPVSRKLSEVISRQNDLLNNSGIKGRTAYVISDFQESVTDIPALASDSGINHFLLPLEANQVANLFIDSCWFESPLYQMNQQARLFARIRNVSSEDFEKIPVKLVINGTQRAVASFDCPSDGEVVVPFSYINNEVGIQDGVLEIVDYPITYDDRFYFSYNVSSTIPVLSISDKNESPYLNALYGKDSGFRFVSARLGNIDYSSFQQYQLIIMNELPTLSSGLIQELKAYLEFGGHILLIPPKDIDLGAYSGYLGAMNLPSYIALDTFNTRVTQLNSQHPLFREVFEKIPENIDLPVVLNHYRLNAAVSSNAEVLLRLENGDPFLMVLPSAKGQCYMLSVSLDASFSNFAKHAVFVPSLFQMALISKGQELLFHSIGSDQPIEFKNVQNQGDRIYKMKKRGSDLEIIPENRILNTSVVFYPHGQIREAGNYALMDGTSEIMGLSFNYDRNESNMKYLDAGRLDEALKKARLTGYRVMNTREKPVSLMISEMSRGIHYWKWFVVLALAFLLAEVALLRLWR